MLNRQPVVITSVDPLQGREGTIVTLKGSGFAPHIRNNCVVIGGMGACARAEPNSTPTELKVRIGPVARVTAGDLLMWPGVGADLHTEQVDYRGTTLQFSETAIFRNGAPVASAGIDFKLTDASPNTYAGYVEQSAASRVELGGLESGPVMRVRFPKGSSLSAHRTVDLCLVLKEPTLAVDFSAEMSAGGRDDEGCLRAIAKTIAVSAGLVGERVFADVARNQQAGELELYVTKPYLVDGMVTLRFGP
jgi:hypothetical protein